MLLVKFYTFAKKRNSVKQPTDTQKHVEFDVYLKDNTSVTHPIIEVAGSSKFPAPLRTLNYARIDKFGRWYFIDSWTSDHGKWIASLSVDPLASWWDDFKGQKFYCLRSGVVGLRNGFALDTMLPATDKLEYVHAPVSKSLGFTLSPTGVCYVVGIVNQSTGGIGATNYYAFTQADFRTFLNYLFSSVDWMQIDGAEIGKSLQKAILNPLQYITGVTMFPFSHTVFSHDPAAHDDLQIGWWSLPGMRYYPLTQFTATKDFEIAIPKRPVPEGESPAYYLDAAPYTEMQMFVPGFGMIPLDTRALILTTKLHARMHIDAITGRASLEALDPNEIPGRPYGQIGVPIRIGQLMQDLVGAARGAAQATVGTIGSALSLDFGGAVSNLVSGVESAVHAVTPSYSSIGSDGSVLDLDVDPYIEIRRYQMVDWSPDIGVAVCQEVAPVAVYDPSIYKYNYLIYSNAHAAIAGTPEECDAVDAALNGGIYV